MIERWDSDDSKSNKLIASKLMELASRLLAVDREVYVELTVEYEVSIAKHASWKDPGRVYPEVNDHGSRWELRAHVLSK